MPLTVAQLIERLQEFPPHHHVAVAQRDHGVDSETREPWTGSWPEPDAAEEVLAAELCLVVIR